LRPSGRQPLPAGYVSPGDRPGNQPSVADGERSLCPRSRPMATRSRIARFTAVGSGNPWVARSHTTSPSTRTTNTPPLPGTRATSPRSDSKVPSSSWANQAARGSHRHLVQYSIATLGREGPSAGVLEFMLNRPADPARHRPVILSSPAADLGQCLRREPDRHHLGEPGAAPAGRALGLLVLRAAVELVLLLPGHLLLLFSHRSSR